MARAQQPTFPTEMGAAQELLNEALGSGVDEEQQKELREYSTFNAERIARYGTAEKYYDGAGPKYLDDRLKSFLEVSGIPYGENFCETVVDALVERLSVIGVTCQEEMLSDWLWTEWYDGNKGDILQQAIHLDAAKFGDAFVILEWDQTKGIPVAHLNRPNLLEPHYDDEDRLECMVKVWMTDVTSPTNPNGHRVKRMNIYYPDRVEKWFTLGRDQKAIWGRWMDDGDKVWPLPWTFAGKPLGIPVFHFANKARTDHMGRPEHWGTIPQQDRLTKELLDLASVMDQLGYPQRYATGFQGTSELKNVPGEVWTTASEGGSFGQFDAANPEGPLGSVNATLQRIATRSNTPAHRFTLVGGYPSGEALKVSEAGLVAKCRNRQTTWGGTWADMMQMAAVIAIAFAGEGGKTPGVELDAAMRASLNVTWADAESRNEKEHMETLQLMKGLGVSTVTILSMMPGIDPKEEMEAREQEDEQAADRQARMMGMGLVPPNPPMNPLNNGTGARRPATEPETVTTSA